MSNQNLGLKQDPKHDPTQDGRKSLVGTQFEAQIGKVAHGGHCVARHDGRVVFVRHALPGETVRVQITDGNKGDRFLLGDAVEVIEASEHRVEPACRFAGPGNCGGCDWQHSDLTYQRELKAAVVAEQFHRLADVDLQVEVEALPGDKEGLRWRTRTEFAIDASGVAGLHRHHSHEIIPVQDCLISTERLIGTGVLERRWPMATSVDVIDASGEGAAMTVPLPSRDSTIPHVTERVDTGDWSAEFHLSARGFWQVHPGAALALVDAVAQAVEGVELGGANAWDLYGGVGLFAEILCRVVGPDGTVVAVESDPGACELAVANLAGHPQASVRHGMVDEVIDALKGPVDAVVLDPPRTGAGPALCAAIAARGPSVIVYVACDPAALGRDTAALAAAGYRLDTLRAFDAFPQTHHVECVARFVPA